MGTYSSIAFCLSLPVSVTLPGGVCISIMGHRAGCKLLHSGAEHYSVCLLLGFVRSIEDRALFPTALPVHRRLTHGSRANLGD